MLPRRAVTCRKAKSGLAGLAPWGLALALCVAGGWVHAQSTITLQGAGATFPAPLYTKWFFEYNKAHPNVRVNYQAIGSGAGIKAIRARTVDFAASDAPLSAAEAASMPGPVIQLPTVGGAVAIAYNLRLEKQLRLTPEAVAGIFLGQITRWDDSKIRAANPGLNLPAKAITVVHRSDGSGTTYLFTQYLSAISPTWKSRVGVGKEVSWPCGQGAKGNPGVAGLVKQIEGAIGYVELAYAKQNKLPVALLRNRSGRFVGPSVTATTAAIQGALSRLEKDLTAPIVNPAGANAYPIAGLTFIIVYKQQPDAARGKALVELLKWMMGPGQKYAPALDYAPLPQALIEKNMSLIGQIV
ncbi:MAG: phosphate ABC transporter substrate-binding protein PstS, partial [Armatimonadetes bacterium]|nr:phosphate ABC transporter substrate-binding protein PstS [Armatimonadota bacterium]